MTSHSPLVGQGELNPNSWLSTPPEVRAAVGEGSLRLEYLQQAPLLTFGIKTF